MAWKEGESGNPSGRPKGASGRVPSDKEIDDYILSKGRQAIDTLVQVLKSKDASTGDKIRAAIYLDTRANTIRQLRKQINPDESKKKNKKENQEDAKSSNSGSGKVVSFN